MPSWILCWLCIILLIGSGAASDVPFVFDKATSDIASYTSAQLEQTHISSPELAGVPSISTPSDNAILNFPVVGGGSTPQGTTEKKVADLRKLFDSRVEPDNPKVHEEAIHIGISHPGDYTIEQVSAIFSYMMNGDSHKNGWSYVHDPRGVNNFFYANETLRQGENAEPKCVGGGGCADFAILMSALVESLGGTTRIVLASNNTTGGHAYAEVYLGQLNDQTGQVDGVIKWLRQEFETDKIFVNINTSTKEVWLNLDWWADEKGIPHPGGPFFTGSKNIVLYIRENYSKAKAPLRLPEKTNKPPKLVSLTSSKPSPQDAGSAITWTAVAKDPDNDQIFYKFFLNDNPVTTSWVKDNKWIWNTTSDDVGENQIEVRVRDEKYGHALPNGFDDLKAYSITITAPETGQIAATNVTRSRPSSVAPVQVTAPLPDQGKKYQKEIQPNNVSYPEGRSSDALIDKGIVKNNEGNYEEAVGIYDQALSLDPGNYLAWELKGLALRGLGKYDEALSCFDKAISIDSNRDEAWKDKGETLYIMGQYQEAVNCFDKAIQIRPCAGYWKQKGEALMGIGKDKEASDAFVMAQRGVSCTN